MYRFAICHLAICFLCPIWPCFLFPPFSTSFWNNWIFSRVHLAFFIVLLFLNADQVKEPRMESLAPPLPSSRRVAELLWASLCSAYYGGSHGAYLMGLWQGLNELLHVGRLEAGLMHGRSWSHTRAVGGGGGCHQCCLCHPFVPFPPCSPAGQLPVGEAPAASLPPSSPSLP